MEITKTTEEEKNEDTIKTKESNKKANTPHKSHRKRKRKLFNAIREQMEFYFGDANLSKDRFLMQLIKEDPFVPLDVFLTFNKLKNITTSKAEIAKSLSNSQLLELDPEQQKVRRKTSIPIDRNVDHKTIYVESLPPTADHDWVKATFSRFGPITYVSLPKYSKSKKIKEFGFVEFENESSVEKAIKAFREFNGVLCSDTIDPAELISVKSFLREQNNENEEKKGMKRKLSTDLNQAQESKRSKEESSNNEHTSTAPETDDPSNQEAEKNKRKRRHKKKKKNVNSIEETNQEAAGITEIRILPKKDWKRLRNKYLNLQREKAAELKRLAWKNSQNEMHHNAKKFIEKPTKRLEKMNMNFYGAGVENDESQVNKISDPSKESLKINPAEVKAPLFTFEPGLIVEVGFLEPCVTFKEFKADMRQYETVKYVDIKEGALSAFLRLDNAQAANDFVKKISCAEYKCKVLTGDAESEYWEKIKQDREAKLNKKVKVPKKRGRERMMKVISKHTRFGDDDED